MSAGDLGARCGERACRASGWLARVPRGAMLTRRSVFGCCLAGGGRPCLPVPPMTQSQPSPNVACPCLCAQPGTGGLGCLRQLLALALPCPCAVICAVLDRLAIVPMSQEARGLDAGQRLVQRLVGHGDKRSAAIVQQIAVEEKAHVAVGGWVAGHGSARWGGGDGTIPGGKVGGRGWHHAGCKSRERGCFNLAAPGLGCWELHEPWGWEDGTATLSFLLLCVSCVCLAHTHNVAAAVVGSCSAFLMWAFTLASCPKPCHWMCVLRQGTGARETFIDIRVCLVAELPASSHHATTLTPLPPRAPSPHFSLTHVQGSCGLAGCAPRWAWRGAPVTFSGAGWRPCPPTF